MPRRTTPGAIALGLALLTVAGTASAQSVDAPPAGGTADLRPGNDFARDISLTVAASGEPVENAAGCPGQYDLSRPEMNLRVVGPARPLRIYARSSDDTVMMVRTPGGEWLCNDDSDGLNPAVSLEPAQPGIYNVWVGPYFSEGGAHAITLYADDHAGTSLDPAARPTAGAARAGSFSPDPREISVEIGADASSEECPGFYSAAPSFNLNYDGDGPLFIYARAVGEEDDLTLAVNLPDGTWECNDDAEGLNPGLGFERPMQGLYNVWVGSFRSRARTEAAPRGTLFLSGVTGPVASAPTFDEEEFDIPDVPEGYSGGEGMVRDGSPRGGTLVYAGGPATHLAVEAGGPEPNPVIGLGCAGYVDPAHPSALVDFSGGGRLAVWADADVDATIVVGLPDGGWICNDDYNGLNPGVVIESAAAGRYPVWVGTFHGDEEGAANLHVAGSEPFGD
jgi:hypothetical protein